MDNDTVTWRKARGSTAQGGDCVELAELPGGVGVRDSKDPGGPKFLLPRDEFAALLAALKL